jgi:hypothetical protein
MRNIRHFSQKTIQWVFNQGVILTNHQQNVQTPIVEQKKPVPVPIEPYRRAKKATSAIYQRQCFNVLRRAGAGPI